MSLTHRDAVREYATREDKDANRFNGYCAACCMGVAHWHPEVEPPQERMGWTWWTAMAVANTLAAKEGRRWRVRSIPIFKRGTDVVIGARYWPEPIAPTRNNLAAREAGPLEVQWEDVTAYEQQKTRGSLL